MMKQEAICIIVAALGLIAADEAGTWIVEDRVKNITCLVAQMNIKANFSYQINDTNKSMRNVLYEVPIDSKQDQNMSSCGADTDKLNVKWDIGNSFEVVFSLDKNSTYDLSNFTISLNASSIFNDSTVNQIIEIAYIHDDSSFKTPSNFSYHCNRNQILNATKDMRDEKFIVLSKVQFEAFKVGNSKTFDLAKDCDSNIKPDIVPIAVGLSLIALIIIVLIAYIVGRRRSQARGYLNIM